MTDVVRVCETVRDAWQGLPHVVATEDKVAFIQRLLDVGFTSVDVGSFVSRKRVPAMADTDDLVGRLRVPEGARITALVANDRGLDRLLAVDGIDQVLFPFSISETFQQRNTRLSREEALASVAALTSRAHDAGRRMYVTISMAFGNREGDPFDPVEQADWLRRLHGAGVDEVSLADTCAKATPEEVTRVFGAIAEHAADLPVPGVHMHTTPATQPALVDAALDAGCRDFDAALGGLGGCQFATGAESNVSTRPLARQLRERGFSPVLPEDAVLAELDAAARELAAR